MSDDGELAAKAVAYTAAARDAAANAVALAVTARVAAADAAAARDAAEAAAYKAAVVDAWLARGLRMRAKQEPATLRRNGDE
jgi:hypothetical protein